ncbi:hypothetical protein FH149_07550, partial [Staphylococcus lugdunensis]|uniref:hypothetical protein n=1 Tax=Staphylococcus lugdunensis TaxID=28035 RepID=UPI001F57FDEC
PQLALLDEFLFRNSLCWGYAPNLLCLMNFFLEILLMLGPRPQLALLDEFLFRNSLCWGPAPNLLCLMNFFLEILFVGAPPPTCFA